MDLSDETTAIATDTLQSLETAAHLTHHRIHRAFTGSALTYYAQVQHNRKLLFVLEQVPDRALLLALCELRKQKQARELSERLTRLAHRLFYQQPCAFDHLAVVHWARRRRVFIEDVVHAALEFLRPSGVRGNVST